uniref:Uncharacterized protein n=1 Tax=Mycena chlorophos TaxID=658473 RepID=A0ABQ0L2U1_MYCCL|nr:predicted protein [Mycena chlorophos]
MSALDDHTYFGSYRPHRSVNARHRVFLRKIVEVVPPEQLRRAFGPSSSTLRARMGCAGTVSKIGQLYRNYTENLRVVVCETDVPDAEVRDALLRYLQGHDACFKKHGKFLILRQDANLAALRRAEREWAAFAERYLRKQGRVRPDWARVRLPGLERNEATPVAPRPVPQPFPLSPPTPKRKADGIEDRNAKRTRTTIPRARKSLGTIDLTQKNKSLGFIDLTKDEKTDSIIDLTK